MKIFTRISLTAALAASLVLPALLASPAAAVDGTPATNSSDSTAGTRNSTPNSDTNTTRLTNIKTKGDAEIARRLKTLNTLATRISAATKLTTADKTSLTNQVNDEIANLTTLKTKLDAETTVAGAIADVQSMITDYRVYALIVPKVQLVKAADDQQAVEDKLTALIAKFETRLNAAKSQGKEVSALQAKLDDMKTQTTTAQGISSSIETKVITLQPSDYDSDHSVLSGDMAQLKTAHSNNEAAYNDAKAIVAGLKAL